MVYERACEHCGTEFKTPYKTQRFCCKTCANRGRRMEERGFFDHSLEWEKDADSKWLCPYQEGVGCRTRRCDKCGWNPDVAKARLDKIMGVK